MTGEFRVEDHLGLVHCIARRYLRRGLEFDDLVQSGGIGLIRAVAKANGGAPWKPAYWIKDAIVMAIIDEGSAIATPAWAYRQVGRWFKLEARLGRPVSASEASEALGWKASWAELLSHARRARTAKTHRITPYGTAAVGDDFVPIRDAVWDDDASDRPELAWLLSAVDRLPPYMRSVLRHRYGLDDGIERPVAEVAARTGKKVSTIARSERVAGDRLREMAAAAA